MFYAVTLRIAAFFNAINLKILNAHSSIYYGIKEEIYYFFHPGELRPRTVVELTEENYDDVMEREDLFYDELLVIGKQERRSREGYLAAQDSSTIFEEESDGFSDEEGYGGDEEGSSEAASIYSEVTISGKQYDAILARARDCGGNDWVIFKHIFFERAPLKRSIKKHGIKKGSEHRIFSEYEMDFIDRNWDLFWMYGGFPKEI